MISGLRSRLKRAVGRASDILLPSVSADVDEGRSHSRLPRIRRAIVESRVHRSANRGDLPSLQASLTTFWRDTDGTIFHTRRNDARFAYFRAHHEPVLDALADTLSAPGSRYTRFVEIGCGDGRVLSHAAKRFPDLEEIVGLDVNAYAVGLARVATDDPRVSIHHADATEWLAENAANGTAIFTNGGVFEYVAPEALHALISAVSARIPATFACIEPISPSHDIASDTGSHVFGRERSFSHNYPARFRAVGLEIAHLEIRKIEDVRWLTIVAHTSSRPEP